MELGYLLYFVNTLDTTGYVSIQLEHPGSSACKHWTMKNSSVTNGSGTWTRARWSTTPAALFYTS